MMQMAGKALILLLAVAASSREVLGQHTPNSLQEAIEALHRHHDILSSSQQQQHGGRHHESPLPHHLSGYFSEDSGNNEYEGGPGQGQLNSALVEYLAREEARERFPSRYAGPDFDEEDAGAELAGYEARKRSIFPQRGEAPPPPPPYKSVFRERDLGQEFLEEMERERMEEEEAQYRATLRRLWDKYQQQENSIERQLFEEQQQENANQEAAEAEEEEDRKKRIGYLPMYFGPLPVKRRDYPLLPWLTNDDDDARKKRFPVRKRSAKPMPEEPNASGTSEKVAKDLQTLFGAVDDKKKKRSADEVAQKKAPEVGHKIEKKSAHDDFKEQPEEEDDEDEHESDDDHEHDHEHDDDSDEDADDEERKKKRDVSVKSAPEVVKDEQIIPGDLSEFKKKKSNAGWSRYFGYDRRKKKSTNWAMPNGKYQSMMSNSHHHAGEESEPQSGGAEEKRKKKDVDPEKLDSMDEKLKNIEDLIIEETVKYTGAHEGVSGPEEIQKLKDHVISRLATAYSLEKMRRALDQLRENVDTERHLLHNEIETSGDDDEEEEEEKKKKKKRIAAKKDDAQKKPEGQLDSDQDKRKRKRNGLDIDGEAECPLLLAMEKRCRGVDILSGDVHQELLPICAVHQLCYLCGTSQASCDLQYLGDAEVICGPNRDCESAARSALMILRGAPGPPHLGPKECARNQCLSNAIRDFTK